jgi:hypothetical protein
MFDLKLRATLVLKRRKSNLPPQYSMKVLHVSGAKPEDQVYMSESGSTESLAIFSNYGEVHLARIGDVNTELETTQLSLAMCCV